MNKKLVSIIIPIYNAEKYLDECLESVTGQTYDNLEIILLPGASNDNSISICKKWAQNDSRILITPQDKNCTGYARNKGISAAHGEYIAFCDADDKMLPEFVEEMISSAIENDSDIVECEYYNASEDLSSLSPYTVPELLSDFPHSFYERFGSSSVWKYLVRRSFWTSNELRFPESNLMEDLAVYSLLFAAASKVSYVYKPLYIYRANPHSVMHTLPDIQMRFDNFMFIASFIVNEHKRLGCYSTSKNTTLSQLEHHAEYFFQKFPNSMKKEVPLWEARFTEEFKKLFDHKISVFEIRAFGWGSVGTGKLSSIMTKTSSIDGKFISQMTFRGVTSENIRLQLEEILKAYKPNIILLDLLEETDYIVKYNGDIEEYLKQWFLGVSIFSGIIHSLCPDAHIFVVEKYLAHKHLEAEEMKEFENTDDINILNELLGIMYKNISASIAESIFIPSIPDSSRYSLDNDPKGGHTFDEAYYYEEIIDIIHDL
ncbi:glycosyltransferase family 2 protein [Butyrivibrio proteoclasticus]|nr:glycosyltransferase [Butyrivibrio proteoclasticus]